MEKNFRMKAPLVTIFFILSCIAVRVYSDQTIVDSENSISEITAKFELAKILSHKQKTKNEALELLLIVLNEKPNDNLAWFEVSRIFIDQENLIDAETILSQLVYQKPVTFQINNLKETPSNQFKKNIPQSIVEKENFIDDEEARFELARVLSRLKQFDEALELYHYLLEKKPEDIQLLLEIGRLYTQKKQYHPALHYLYFAIEFTPNDPELLVAAAHAELGLEHAKESLTLLEKALTLSDKKESIWMDLASVYMLIGSFYKAEFIYKSGLCKQPDSKALTLQLAWTYVSAQRYEEAEEIYKKLLLKNPYDVEILQALIILKMIEKDFNAALDLIDRALEVKSEEESVILLKGEALYKSENYVQALDQYNRINENSAVYIDSLIGKGKAYLKLGNCEEAQKSFQRALEINPDSIQAQFYLAGSDVYSNGFVQNVINSKNDPKSLVEWDRAYAEIGLGGKVEIYEKALEIDPNYYSAKIGLAAAFSSQYQYDKAQEKYLSILEDFPQASKIMLEVARVYSWSKMYSCSMEWYDRIIGLNPVDPVPRKEKARVAYWGKYFELSMQTYESLIEPSVDVLFYDALIVLKEKDNCRTALSSFLANYTTYEAFIDFIQKEKESCQLVDDYLEAFTLEYWSLYLIQKRIRLERDAKNYDWQNYFMHALPIYQELANLNPGNLEGLYGYAQDFCSLGLCHCSRQLYLHILNIEPNNSLVKMALTRNLLREHPLVQLNYSYWTEKGSGQFANSQIARQQLDEIFEWSPQCNTHFRFIQNEWLEYPFFKEKYYPAEGQTIELDHIFNGYVKGFISGTYKNYFHLFPSRYTCISNLWFNVYDYGNIGIGFERKNEIYNYFTLKQGIQSKNCWVTLKAASHAMTVSTTYEHLEYNDSNSLDHINLFGSYQFSEDPKVFKIILNANYRNTAHETRIINSEGKVVNIIHPYWTPKHYYAGAITFEFRYNYAWFNYCEAPQRFIDIKITGENDTAHNPSFELAVNWKHEFARYWGVEVSGLFHRSRLWNADGIWAQVYYRF
ncbi:MAG: tetratricopeptide repeat protein [Parachlamydiaceae bacterium]|nr:tetratricopeptide repeat protein [Parachlamydiaceae bacterium]